MNRTTIFQSLLLLIFYIISGSNLFAQEATVIRGTVTDVDENPLIGAAVRVIGTEKGLYTDIEGGFELEISPDDSILISYIGYASRKVTYLGEEEQDIQLDASPLSLEGITISTGIWCPGCRATLCPVHIVEKSVRDLNPGLASNTHDLIEGNIRITCYSTKNLGNDPLIIVDGIPLLSIDPLQVIHPGDIKEITVLNNQKALALWGCRASNGIILVTTHSQRVPQFSFSSKLGKAQVLPSLGMKSGSLSGLTQAFRIDFNHNFDRGSIQTNANYQYFPALTDDFRNQQVGGGLRVNYRMLGNKLEVGGKIQANYIRLQTSRKEVPSPSNPALRNLPAEIPQNFLNGIATSFVNYKLSYLNKLRLDVGGIQSQSLDLGSLKTLNAKLQGEFTVPVGKDDIKIEAALSHEQFDSESFSLLQQQAFGASTTYSNPIIEASSHIRIERNQFPRHESSQYALYTHVEAAYNGEFSSGYCSPSRGKIISAAAGIAETPFGRITHLAAESEIAIRHSLPRLNLAYNKSWTQIANAGNALSAEALLFFPAFYQQLDQQGFHADLTYYLDRNDLYLSSALGFTAGNGLSKERYHLRNTLEWKGLDLDWRLEGIRGWKLSPDAGDFFRLANLDLGWSLKLPSSSKLEKVRISLTGQNLLLRGDEQVLRDRIEMGRLKNPLQYPFALSRNLLAGIEVDLK